MLSDRNLVVSIDVPSGLNADTGEAEGDAVRADITVTMGLPKVGLSMPAALDYVGTVEVVDIGIPSELVAELPSSRELVVGRDLDAIMTRRPRDAHKGLFGHILIVAGARGYAGAAALAARAALRSGVGLVSVLCPSSVVPVVAGLVPEAMVHGGPETDEGSLASACIRDWSRRLNQFGALLVGPGMMANRETSVVVERILGESRVPVILDADALNTCDGRTDRIKRAPCPVVITPHPGEMGRLLNCSASEVQADREAAALHAAALTESVVVLKGAGTLVAERDRPLHVNLTGNPGMACGGMGDVLGGLMAGLVAQCEDPFDAARAAVYLHGRAGDLAAWRMSQIGLKANDVVEMLPFVFRELSPR
jgi:NAD(P)H-hydrate epimerase